MSQEPNARVRDLLSVILQRVLLGAKRDQKGGSPKHWLGNPGSSIVQTASQCPGSANQPFHGDDKFPIGMFMARTP
jgi:hypothetical protein